ncbi:hypothetical protein SAMN05216499_112132 [Actinacidiphila paucisporea]|uniref:Lipoprotein n=2 Tax=Actinacidiphila paucisporea TaxID=310782 RepID=A0A1M7K431_9ACTN|nr:hypothetical protein SAMN05216499_112132 [Actinacidiphila paucisporea]
MRHRWSPWTHRTAGLAVVAVLLGAAAGCGSGSGPGPTAGAGRTAADFATLHGGPAHDQLALPVDAYAYTVAERDQLALARSVTTGECLRQFGYAYDFTADKAENALVARRDLMDFGLYGNKRRYNVTDPAVAAAYGYHLVSTVTGVEKAAGSDRHGLGDRSAAEDVVLTGNDPAGTVVSRTPAGRPIPAGGCAGQGNGAFTNRDGTIGDPATITGLRSASFDRSEHDPKVTSALRAWSACLLAKGRRYASPLDDPGFDIESRTVSPAEAAAARADVACKQQTHLTDTWLASEVTYQRQWIAAHPADFRAATAEHDATMKRVVQVIAAAR